MKSLRPKWGLCSANIKDRTSAPFLMQRHKNVMRGAHADAEDHTEGVNGTRTAQGTHPAPSGNPRPTRRRY